MFNENEMVDAPISAEEAEKELQIPQFADPANPTPEEALKAIDVAKSALAQKKHWREKAFDPQSKKLYKDLLPAPKSEPSTSNSPVPEAELGKVNDRVAALENEGAKRHFGYANSLSPDEVDEVFAYAKGNGIAPADALKKPFMKGVIENLRRDSRNSSNTPGPSNRAPAVDGKPFKEMNREDRKKNFQAVVSSITGKK